MSLFFHSSNETPSAPWRTLNLKYVSSLPYSLASSAFLRLAEYQSPIFPKLQSLRSDVSFAASLPPRKNAERNTIDVPDLNTSSASIRAIKWQVPTLQTLHICYPEFDNGQYHATPFTSLCSIANLAGFKNFRSLNIKSHLVDYDSIVQLSAFDNLEDLCVKTTSSVPSDNRQTQDGFPSLKSLHISAKVSEMPRILRLVRQGTLETLTFIDTSNEAFHTSSEFMMDFHRELVARFPLRNLSLTYWAAQLGKALWASSRAVFEPLYELPRLRSIHFVGELAMDDETIKTSLAPSWPHIESISVPQFSGDTPSYVVLSVFAKCCPRLVSLAMPIGFPDDGVLSVVERVFQLTHLTLLSRGTTHCPVVLVGEDNPSPEGIFEFCSIASGGPWLRLVVSPALLHMQKPGLNARRLVSGYALSCSVYLSPYVHILVFYMWIYTAIGDGVEEAFCTTDRVTTCSFHKYGEYFPGTGTQEDKGRGKEKDNVLLKDGITDESSQSIFEPVVDKILEVFQCNAAQTLSRETNSVARCTDMPIAFSGYTVKNVARTRSYEAATALGIEDTIDPNLPRNEYFEWFGPRYRLEVVASNIEDMHVKDGSSEQVRVNALEHVRELNNTPFVDMHDTLKRACLSISVSAKRTIPKTNWTNA
ncbi:uncharacterized protein ARMOST_10229 [Armillaria ostoyae]|uniref:Histone deacetylase domain-containing protein n=1 Tax=Armillaria ostoyae TaxID=47428 RepID=A0A284RDQ2_ARMOS|nr:uncharacterized protein ARMOST_10229 [Armillaria ostoyae]